ncbi:MAG: nucleoside deaminase [Actinobacteria bacterium]|nr:nucleoside deaminase [Actinomycetota bacterium]
MGQLRDDEALMRRALDEAQRALDHNDVPIGALVVDETGAVVATAHNERERAGDPTAHAEILALRKAAEACETWRLDGLTVVATVEPCPMCAGALVNARVKRLVFGAFDSKAGACGSLYNLCSDPRLNHEVAVTSSVLAPECAAMLERFFAERR